MNKEVKCMFWNTTVNTKYIRTKRMYSIQVAYSAKLIQVVLKAAYNVHVMMNCL
jgi:hypothetical protein